MTDCCSSCNTAPPARSVADLRWALRLETWTIAWMVVEASVSIGAGIAAGSLLLVAFGADSIIELISGCVLYWRLRHEYRGDHRSEASLEALERRTGKIAGYLLYALSAYVVAQAVWGLMRQHEAETSLLGMAVAVVAAVGMPILAKAKIRVADRIDSPALRADAMETFTCGYLSWVLLGGLVANALLHWWWLDSVASLLVVPLLLREAKEAITGHCSCHQGRGSEPPNCSGPT
jgi:divalent metal cation (Fe/Co/Zn/Cd) transporter